MEKQVFRFVDTQPIMPNLHLLHTLSADGSPRDHDIVIEIHYCGICHSDIHQVSDEWGGLTFPMVPGHEIAGIVFQIGTNVTRYKVGDRVGVGCFVDSCPSVALVLKGLNNIVWVDCLSLTMGSKRTEKPQLKGAIRTKL